MLTVRPATAKDAALIVGFTTIVKEWLTLRIMGEPMRQLAAGFVKDGRR